MASITINTNLASLTAQRNLSQATGKMNTAMERLTTGFRINSGKDDAAGSAVSNLMEAQISGYDVAEANTQMGLTLLDTAEGVLSIVGDYVQRIRDLTEQAANGTYGTASLQAIRTEVQQRMLEINRLCDVIDFNGIKLLDGTSVAATSKAGINLQVGNNTGMANVINLDYTLFESAKLTALLIQGNKSSTGYGEEDPTSTKMTDWAKRTDESEITGALWARLNNDEADYGNIHYDYTDTKKYKDILNTDYDPLNDKANMVNGQNCCITAICDENCLGCCAYFKMLAVESTVGLECYPKDAVLLCHGVLDRSDEDLDLITLDLCDGDVLFVACLDRSGDELGHLLTAAHKRYFRVVNLLNKVAAMLTDIKLNVVLHY